ncbi:MAG: DUF2721 domain-containing protein [Candidatus Caenarcaniphilales bacterium]|nr:DUF2721 domain-containing protein [Candidatus Caenarcaniphilales bacterium]
MDITAPAVLLSTISLLMLAFTNRFLTTASVARNLHEKYLANPQKFLLPQIHNLKLRIKLIRDMQTIGVSSLFLFVLSMFLIFTKHQAMAKIMFGSGLVLLMVSLIYSTIEIYISTQAIDIQLRNLEEMDQSKAEH